MAELTFHTASGQIIRVEASAGLTLMRAARDAGVPGIIGECGGSATCLTCHCYVVDKGAGPLPPPDDHETAMLDLILDSREGSRLSCQIVVNQDREGMILEVPSSQG